MARRKLSSVERFHELSFDSLLAMDPRCYTARVRAE